MGDTPVSQQYSRNVERHELDGIYDEITGLQKGQASLSTSMENLSRSQTRIENKLDNPPPPPKAPSWVAIGMLAMAVVIAQSTLFFTILILTNDPLREGVYAEAKNRKENDERLTQDIKNVDNNMAGMIRGNMMIVNKDIGRLESKFDAILLSQELLREDAAVSKMDRAWLTKMEQRSYNDNKEIHSYISKHAEADRKKAEGDIGFLREQVNKSYQQQLRESKTQ